MAISKADLSILKGKRTQDRLLKIKEREESLKMKELEKQSKTHHSFISNLLKRIRGIEPWAKLLKESDPTITLLTYFKFKQIGLNDIKLMSNNINTWIEFKYVGIDYIFDLSCIKDDVFNIPILKSEFNKNEKYFALKRTFNSDRDFYAFYSEKIPYSFDELKINSMQDPTLNQIFRPKNK